MGEGDLGWALGADDLAAVLALLDRIERPQVVELGAGDGTAELARGVAERRGGLTSVEHDPAWVERVSGAIAAARLAATARVFHAPLEAHPLASPGVAWYSDAALQSLPARIDLLLVDGPPAGEPGQELARMPALEALESRLGSGALVVLDDAQRPGEQAVLRRWEEQTEFRFSPLSNGRAAVGSRPGR